MSPSGHKVFICYRREETAAHAGRLYDAMVARFGEHNVFMDVDLAPGVDFAERITEVVSGCLALIVVMGPSWGTVQGADGEPRIADPDDFVRLEVETGLNGSAVTAVPVLVGGAQMPPAESLPPGVRPLARRNAVELSDARWGYDVGRLNDALDELLSSEERTAIAARTAAAAPPPPPPAPLRGRAPAWRLIPEGMLVGGAVAYLARWLGKDIPDTGSAAAEIAGILLRRGEVWALTAAALALWLGFRTFRPDRLQLALLGLIVGALAGIVGGAVFALPAYLPDPNLDSGTSKWIEVPSAAVTGAFLGALIGYVWRRSRLIAGLSAGLLAGGFVQVLIGLSDWKTNADSAAALKLGLTAAAIAGAALATMLALDRRPSDPDLPSDDFSRP